jgi:acetyl esterase/lipase
MTKRYALLAALMCATGLAAQQNRSPVDLAMATVPPGAVRIPYGADPLQFGELRVPSGNGPHPVAIVVHGGCWASELGRMDPVGVSIANMRPLAAALTDAGVATWNIEYRRLGNAGGGWPGTYKDVAAAADALRGVARERGLDLKRAIAVGHSSGGHLALWLAARTKIAPSSDIYTKDPIPLTAAVSLDGPGDLNAMFLAQQSICGRPVITELMGGTPDEQPDRYRAASPAELLPTGVRVASLAGKAFAAQNATYEAAATKAGDSFQAVTIPTAGHFVFIDPQSDVFPQVRTTVRRLLGLEK